MPKKAGTSASVGKRLTAEAILDLIDSLPPVERSELFERLAHHPENKKANAWWYVSHLGDAFKRATRRAIENELRFEQELDLANAELQDAQEELRNSVP